MTEHETSADEPDPLSDARYAAIVKALRTDGERVTARNLLKATRLFLEEKEERSWRYVGSTLLLLIAGLAVAAMTPWWPLRLAASVASGLVLGRTFILYHDFMHGAILRGSRLAKLVMHAVGLAFLAPPRSWWASHNYHHANVARLDGPAIGTFPIMTVAAWRRASRGRRFRYRFSRHPLTLATAYITVFFYSLTLEPLFKHPRKYWDSLLALGLHAGVIAGLWLGGGAAMAFFAFLLPFAIASALGAYLFYAQHNAEGLRMFPPGEWTFFRAALQSSSYMRLGPIMTWFLGNIGYHHVHHLNPAIPFYRLSEAMAAIPMLQHPTMTSLRPRDIAASLRANLWDEERAKLVSFRSATQRQTSSRPPAAAPGQYPCPP